MIFTNEKESIKAIAKNNNITPQELYNEVKPVDDANQTSKVFPEKPYPEFGKNTIRDISKKYNLSEDELLIALSNLVFNVKESDSIKI